MGSYLSTDTKIFSSNEITSNDLPIHYAIINNLLSFSLKEIYKRFVLGNDLLPNPKKINTKKNKSLRLIIDYTFISCIGATILRSFYERISIDMIICRLINYSPCLLCPSLSMIHYKKVESKNVYRRCVSRLITGLGICMGIIYTIICLFGDKKYFPS